MSLQALLFNANGQDKEVEIDTALCQGLTDKQLLWIDVLKENEPEIRNLAKILHLEEEPVEVLLNPQGRPKVFNYKDYFLVNVVAVKDSKDSKHQNMPITFVVGKNYVVTIHEEEINYLNELREREKGDSEIGTLSAESFIASLLDWHLSTYFQLFEKVEIEVDKFDERILAEETDDEFLNELFTIRRHVGHLRRMLLPHQDVFYALSRPDFVPIAKSDTAAHFQILTQRFERAVDAIENSREIVLSSFELFTTKTAQYTNETVKLLTFVTVLTGLMGVIAGILGMNFDVPFFQSGATGFMLVVGGMILLAISAVVLGKWRKWL